MKIDQLPNIGKTLAGKLEQVGIDSQDQLISMGVEDTFIKLKTVEIDTCLNMLYALEGAIQGIRWHKLDKARKLELNEFWRLTDKLS